MPIRLGNSLGTNSGTVSSGTITLTTTADCLPGDLILVFVGLGASSTGETLTVTDSAGNIYITDVTSIGSVTSGFFIARSIATVALPSGSTITGTLGAASVNRLIAAANFTGIDNLVALDKTSASSGTDVNWNSGNTLQTTQTQELIIGGSCMFSLTQGSSTPGAGLAELHDFGTTATAMTTAWKVVTLTGIQNVSGTWAGTSGGENRRDGVVTYRRRPEGTTTSTSSTSISSTSSSSTSSSTSSTSSSISTSSTSASSTSTSISTSSTSTSTSLSTISTSSTSSSISSISTSSTSSSTSQSSTSSSISSTSQSSTSISSTSSSTSISSTSSSISSTSSSASSTSRSTSSTSFSSTSSSSSTSTTAIPLNLDYSYQDTLNLPSIPTDETDVDTSKNYQNMAVDDGDYFTQYGSEYMIQEYKKDWTTSSDIPTFTYKGRSTLSTLISPIYIQIYNQNSVLWETLAVVNTIPPDTDFQISVTQSINVSNYFDAKSIVVFRVYQQVI